MIPYSPTPFIWVFGLPLSVHSLGILVGMLFFLWVFAKEARRHEFSFLFSLSALLWTFIPGFIGARLFYFLGPWYPGPWTHFFVFWRYNGLVLFGGLILGTLGGIWFAKRKGMSVGLFADWIAPALALGQFFARIGCFLVNDGPGIATNVFWAVPHVGIASHPVHIYSSLGNMLIFIALINLKPFAKKKFPGFLFLSYLVMYSVLRLLTESVRLYSFHFLGLSASQFIALGVMTLSLSLILYKIGRNHSIHL